MYIYTSKFLCKGFYEITIQVLDANNILYNYQFGFREKLSTQKASIAPVEKETGNIIIEVFLDLKKAFDTVPHDILPKKLHAYGIRGKALELLKSYLTDRCQYVVYDGKQSSTLPFKCGVPLGSILVPLLFIITMDNIGNISRFVYSILYADDTCVLLMEITTQNFFLTLT